MLVKTRIILGLIVVAAVVATLGACGSGGSSNDASGGKPLVVVAENFWASIAAQIGGSRVTTVSIITNPDTDPHAYEPLPRDARAVAQARYVIFNGAGYDPWAPKLLRAGSSGGRRELEIARLARRKEGDNPHMWYSPAIVALVVHRITADLQSIDPKDAATFAANAAAFKTAARQRYDALRADIRTKYAGVPVGSTESIFVDLAGDLGLRLLTPPGYMKAISEGIDPVAADKATFDSQISTGAIKVLVFNKQNTTPDVQTLVDKARAKGIPVVPITETVDPATATFQNWQGGQLAALQQALARAGG